MKIKILGLIAIVASVTLSFTFAQVTTSKHSHKQEEVKNLTNGSEPVGGFVAIEITK